LYGNGFYWLGFFLFFFLFVRFVGFNDVVFLFWWDLKLA
jgi:hypothetical protein